MYVAINNSELRNHNLRSRLGAFCKRTLRKQVTGRIIVADGGQQFVRRINVCDWSVVRDRNNIKLKYCLRQKENLVSFTNAYSQRLDILGGKVLTRNNMPGGKVIITTDDQLMAVHRQEIKRLCEAGNIPYDMLYLVPHALGNRTYGERSFSMKPQFEQNGIYIFGMVRRPIIEIAIL